MWGSKTRIAVPVFREQQQPTQWWIKVLAIGTAIVVIVIFGWGMYQQFVLGESFGDNPMSDTALLIMGPLFILLFGIGLPVLIMRVNMTTELDGANLLIRYAPFYAKCIPIAEIATATTRTYRPIREYGGWGIKCGPSGWVYNISGDRGVQLVLTDGKRILIGSREPERLETALRGVGVAAGAPEHVT